MSLIRTADQILADVEELGGDGDSQSRPNRRTQIVRSVGLVFSEPEIYRMCDARDCPNPSHDRKYCSGHRRRLQLYGDLQVDRPLRCRCGNCPATARKRRVVVIGDVWLPA